jgi:CHASE3 domain sensor protein
LCQPTVAGAAASQAAASDRFRHIGRRIAVPFPTGRKVTLALVSAAAVIAIAGGAAVLSLRSLVNSGRWVSHTHAVPSELASVVTGVERAEAAVRAVAVGRNTTFLVDHRRGVAGATAALSRARALTADNPDQQRRLAALEQLLATRRQQLAAMSALGAAPGESAGHG